MTFEINYLLPPVVGGVIGYITNDVAIRMLFRPHRAKHVWGWRVPFTPGIIPKEKGRIAAAVGEAISDNLMSREVLERTLLSAGMRAKIGQSIDRFFDRQRANRETLAQFLGHYLSEADLAQMAGSVEGDLGRLMAQRLHDASMGGKIAHAVVDSVVRRMEATRAGRIGQALGMGPVAEIVAAPLEKLLTRQVNELMRDSGPQMVDELLREEGGKLMDMAMCDLVSGRDEQISELREALLKAYATVIADHLPRILRTLDISRIIEERINEMDMDQTERVVFDVMDRELRALIWFGAMLGFLIGLVNALV